MHGQGNSIFLAYVKWHYGQGLQEVSSVAHNFLWFLTHFFSFKLLLKTLFYPWKRMGESYGSVFNVGTFTSTFIVNTLMRIVGFLSRSVVLLVGFLSYIVVLSLSVIVFLIWVMAPILLISSLVLAVTFILV